MKNTLLILGLVAILLPASLGFADDEETPQTDWKTTYCEIQHANFEHPASRDNYMRVCVSEAEQSYSSGERFLDTSRRPGGEWHALKLDRPQFIKYFSAEVLTGTIKFHDAYAVLQNGSKIRMRDFSKRIVHGLYDTIKPDGSDDRTQYFVLSSNFRAGQKVAAVYVRAEGLSNETELELNLHSEGSHIKTKSLTPTRSRPQ